MWLRGRPARPQAGPLRAPCHRFGATEQALPSPDPGGPRGLGHLPSLTAPFPSAVPPDSAGAAVSEALWSGLLSFIFLGLGEEKTEIFTLRLECAEAHSREEWTRVEPVLCDGLFLWGLGDRREAFRLEP